VLLTLVIVYLLITIAIGLMAAKRVQNSADFAIAGRHLPMAMVITTTFATWFGSETVLGIPAKFVNGGLHGVVEDPFGAGFCLIFVGLFFAGKLYRMTLLTISDYFRERYGRVVEVACSLIIMISYLGWVSAQVTALGLVFNLLSDGVVSMELGMVIGVVANQPMVRAGALDMDAADKIARFVRMCNVFNVPLITLVDVPGFLPGVEQERGGIIRHGAKMLHAFASCTTPKVTVILRKAYGGSYLAMCSQEMRADMVYAWPSAEIAVMGAEAAVKILYRKEIEQATDRKEKAAELAQDYRDKFASPYAAASNFYITDVIDPADTRWMLALALRKLLGKRELRPAKKHGNMPL